MWCGTGYDYDAAGNLIREQSPAGTREYTYDDANRLAELRNLAGEVVRYAYDHNGNRLSQYSGGTTTHYLVDPNQDHAQVLEEATAQGTAAAQLSVLYTFGDMRIARRQAASGSTPAALRHYHADGLGSTRLLTDAAGTPTDWYAYEAFGELDTAVSQQASDNAFLFTGEQHDAVNGRYYLRARYFDPQSGRFDSMDAFPGMEAEPSSLHRYLYVANDPANEVDPSGLTNLMEVQGAPASAGINLNLAVLRTTQFARRAAANDALWAAPGGSYLPAAGAGLLAEFALIAERTLRDRFLGIPVIVFGSDFSEHSAHIADAQRGDGSNTRGSPFALNRIGDETLAKHPRGWLRSTPECNAAARRLAGSGKVCDEYPFASSRQGGQANYFLGSVSLRFVAGNESNGTGQFIDRFYRTAPLSRDGFSSNSRFIALGIPNSRSFFIDRQGLVHYK